MTHKVHVSVNIQGILARHKRQKIEFFSDDDGNPISDKAAREYINDCLQKGWKLLPCCKIEECPNFNYETGCPGHHEE